MWNLSWKCAECRGAGWRIRQKNRAECFKAVESRTPQHHSLDVIEAKSLEKPSLIPAQISHLQRALDHSIPFSFLIFYNSVLLGPAQHFHTKSPAHTRSAVFVFSRCTHRAARSNLTTHTCPALAPSVHFPLWVAQHFHVACNPEADPHLPLLPFPCLSKKYTRLINSLQVS